MPRIIIGLSERESFRPLPSKKGDFCGNVLREAVFFASDGVTVIGHKWSFSYLRLADKTVKFRIGKPEASPCGSSSDMEAQGYIGLYLEEDQPPILDEQEVDTDELQEEVVSGQRVAQKPFRRNRGL